MSYLNSLRLHFAGKFQANVSTVNNDAGHYDNATFRSNYQKMEGPGMKPPNGWFNPQGDAAWRLLGCTVTAAWTPSGAVPGSDSVLQCIVADSDAKAPAKLVDLDSEQQLVSEIWGLQVRIADANGKTLLLSDFDPAAFMDIWDRAVGEESGGDVDASAVYQSVLTNLQWQDVSASPFLTALKAAASDGLLSIKFNVDNINMDFTSPDFMCGRITGTIGPAAASEPRHLVIGRQFMAAPATTQFNFFFPAGGINYFPAVVDAGASCILLDLGNALTTDATTGLPNDIGDLALTVAGTATPLGTIPSQGTGGYAADPTWYSRTAGVVALPLTAAQLQAVAAAPLTLASKSSSISEWTTGAFVRADRFVYRMSPGDSADIAVYAMQWGQPLEGAGLAFTADSSQLQPGSLVHPLDKLPVATPLTAIQFSSTATTDKNGMATMTLKTSDPGTPRYFNQGRDYGIDGQVYGIRPSLTHAQFTGPDNQWNFISVLLWSSFKTAQPVTWTDVEPIFVQYANLYPVMNRFLNLADYNSVVANASLLTLAFGLDPTNPNAMPVTRDLSPAKREAILSFLAQPLPGAQQKAAVSELERAAEPELSPAATKAARMGGKAAAAARRLVRQTGKNEVKS